MSFNRTKIFRIRSYKTLIIFIIILFVLASPHFVHKDKMKRQHFARPVSSSVRFKCKATGNPIPHIAWLKDNEVINNHGKKPMWTLKLLELTKAHSGKYTCLVNNRLGSINYTYTLDVIGKCTN